MYQGWFPQSGYSVHLISNDRHTSTTFKQRDNLLPLFLILSIKYMVHDHVDALMLLSRICAD